MAPSTHPTTIRLGTASPASQPTTSETLSLISKLAHRAASQGIDILLLPEAFLGGGYPRGSTFGCAIGSRSEEGREEFRRYFRSAVDLGDIVGEAGAGGGSRWVRRELGEVGDGQEAEGGEGESWRRGDGTRERLEEIARLSEVFLVVGCIERAGGSLYCSVVYVCPKMGIIGKRRKVMPTGTERLVWAQGSPATLRAVSTTIRGVRINMAAAICWESYMPLLRQSLYAQNINLYLAPTADGRDAWLSLIRTVGIEGRCFVVSSNMCVRSQLPDQASAASVPRQQYRRQQQRRESVITEDGFEIALAVSPSTATATVLANPTAPPGPVATTTAARALSWSPTRQRRRRKSVFDEDGNEIVLCCDVEDDKSLPDEDPKRKAPNGMTSPPAPSSTATLSPVAGPQKTKELLPPSPAAAPAASKTGFISRGGSCIVGPFGDVLAGPQWEDDEGIVYTDVDFEDCIRGRLDLDTAGSYSRNDSFKFSVEGLDLSALPY